MSFSPLPATAAWLHRDARDGFEVAFFEPVDEGVRITGGTAAVEDGGAWFVEYDITVDAHWMTRRARVTGRSASGPRSVELAADGAGRWLADGIAAPELDGCLDVDIESSIVTNTLPAHRMRLPVAVSAPAAYVRAADLGVGRLEQTYRRTGERTFDYHAPAFDFTCELVYDASGLVLDYPGLAVRAL